MLKTLLCERLQFNRGMKHFKFFILIFLIIIIQVPNVGSAQINESQNLNYPSNIIIDIIVIIICTVIGVIIGVFITRPAYAAIIKKII